MNNFQLSLVVFAVIALTHVTHGQQILQGTNYNTGDQSRQEVVDANGNIRGQYSYVDPTGKVVLVRYTAGLGGFQVEDQPQQVQPLAPIPPQPVNYPLTNSIDQPPLQLPRNKYQGQLLFQPSLNNYASPATQGQLNAYQQALRDEPNEPSIANTITQDYAPAQFPKTQPAPRPFPLRPYRPQYGFVPGSLGFPLFVPNQDRAVTYQRQQNGPQNIIARQFQYERDATPISEEQDQYRLI